MRVHGLGIKVTWSADDLAGLGPLRRSGSLDANPIRLARDRLIGTMRLFRMAWLGLNRSSQFLLARIFVEKIEDDGHILTHAGSIRSFSVSASGPKGNAAHMPPAHMLRTLP